MKIASNFTLKTIISYQIIFAMSHFLQDVIEFSLFLGLAGNKEGDKISFRSFSLL